MERVDLTILQLSRILLIDKVPGMAMAVRKGGVNILFRGPPSVKVVAVRTGTVAQGSRGNLTRLGLSFSRTAGSRSRLLMGSSACALALFQLNGSMTGCAAAAKSSGKDDDGEDDVDKMVSRWGPVGSEISFGALLGFSSGYALKKIGKATAFIIGCAFIAAQVAAYTGVLQVNWRKVEDNVITLLDQDGDRKLTKKDLSVVWKRVKTLLVHQLPSSGGFATGFAFGFYKG